MLDVVLCCSPADREVAAAIAARLERGAEAKVWLEECGSAQTVATAWEAGLSSAAILLLLSPDTVPGRLTRAAWQSVLQHVERHASPPLCSVLVRDCSYPRLLERTHFFRWGDGAKDVLRALERWVLSLYPDSERRSFVPAPLPWFRGRQDVLEVLWDALVDQPGAAALVNAAPGSGKTSLAQEFARVAGDHFRDTLWVDCGGRSQAFIAADLAAQLSVPPDAPLGEVIQEHRLLLVLDDVAGEAPIVASSQRLASVLITSRSRELPLPPHVRLAPIESAGAFTLDQPPVDPVDLRLWQAMAVCRPNGSSLELAARIAGVGDSEARTGFERLAAQGWVDPLDAAGTRFRLNARSFQAAQSVADGEALRHRHAQALHAAFSHWRTSPAQCQGLVAELENGLDWALRHDWSLATRLAGESFTYLSAHGRLREAAQIYEQLREAARERQDAQVVDNCSWELSWIQDDKGEVRRPPAIGQQLTLDFA